LKNKKIKFEETKKKKWFILFFKFQNYI
jgi:alkyl hydroperoxide reductase subunit AhpC